MRRLRIHEERGGERVERDIFIYLLVLEGARDKDATAVGLYLCRSFMISEM
jgi:hypothetical protein